MMRLMPLLLEQLSLLLRLLWMLLQLLPSRGSR